MTAFIKKQGPAFYFNILSAAAGIAAFIAMVISSTMNEAYGSIPSRCLYWGQLPGYF